MRGTWKLPRGEAENWCPFFYGKNHFVLSFSFLLCHIDHVVDFLAQLRFFSLKNLALSLYPSVWKKTKLTVICVLRGAILYLFFQQSSSHRNVVDRRRRIAWYCNCKCNGVSEEKKFINHCWQLYEGHSEITDTPPLLERKRKIYSSTWDSIGLGSSLWGFNPSLDCLNQDRKMGRKSTFERSLKRLPLTTINFPSSQNCHSLRAFSQFWETGKNIRWMDD